MSDQWMERLSEYLDDELSGGERIALEAHLQGCPECSGRPGRPPPGRELEPGCSSNEPPAARSLARRSPSASAPEHPTWIWLPGQGARWSFSLPQLAAAAILLMTLSGGAVWLLRSTVMSPGTSPVATIAAPPGTPATINASNSASQSYAAAVADLERVLASGRGQLDTTTVRVIEQNLAAIDRQ